MTYSLFFFNHKLVILKAEEINSLEKERDKKERERRNLKRFKEVTEEAGELCGKFGVSLAGLVAKLEAAVPITGRAVRLFFDTYFP